MALAGTVTEKAPRSTRGRSLRLLASLLVLAVVAWRFWPHRAAAVTGHLR